MILILIATCCITTFAVLFCFLYVKHNKNLIEQGNTAKNIIENLEQLITQKSEELRQMTICAVSAKEVYHTLQEKVEETKKEYDNISKELNEKYQNTEKKLKDDFILLEENCLREFENKQKDYQAELKTLEEKIYQFSNITKCLNESIQRQKELEQENDFYRIVLSDQDKNDIQFLLSISNDLKNKNILFKLIWSEYLQKPFNELLKRQFRGNEPKGVIYKITNLKTKECYIGKTKSNVGKRWTDHIKTSLGIGITSKSKIHEALFSHWDEFSFEVLEKIEKDCDLSSSEKFYIDFYQSNVYGYNLNVGG